ncbi:AraC family transcriptional regulator [Maricurvus nonylphenolicus]|uniref:AraC family transcriptional regulator n=1 Tax=Maricurvus nonylphenolicus TaxID=1008307 RepID=UPI0036F2163B
MPESAFYIRSAVLAPCLDLIKELGSSPDEVLRLAGFRPAQLADPDCQIAHHDFLRVIETAAEITGCAHFGLLLGERNSLQSLGLLGLLLRSAPSYRAAIQEMIKHLGIHVKGITRELHCDNGVACLTTRFENPDVAASIIATQMSVATNWKICQLLSHHLWHPSSINFIFDEPENSFFYRRFFNTPVNFNADFNGVAFKEADLDLPLREHDPMLHQEMQRQISKIEKSLSDSFVDDVKRFISQNMDAGICNIDAVVRFFPFQKRAFQQKLKREGVSYQDLVDEVRFQRAEFHLLKSNLTLSQLADVLCYRNVSVFSTAFKNKYGISPSAWKADNL